MAAIYENNALKEERVIKEVTMLPGCDGVETGIVEITDGQAVVVYLKTIEPQVDTPAKGTNPMVYLLIGSVVAGALLIAVVLVATKPKKK